MLKPGINVKLGVPLFFIALIVSWLALYGGAQLVKQDEASADAISDGPGGGPVGPGPVNVTNVAQNLSFDQSTLTANAGSEFNVTLDNQDSGVLHNIAFYTDASLSQPIQVGDLLTGPGSETVTFTAPVAGTYFFRCDVHPDTMNGAFIVQ